MNSPVPLMEPAAWSTLILDVARGDTHQSRYVANFLLAWWNAAELSGFDLTEAWGVDSDTQDDMVTAAPRASTSGSTHWGSSGQQAHSLISIPAHRRTPAGH